MSKHSIQTFKSSSSKWRKRLLWAALVAVLLPPLIFLRDVYRIPDYRGGTAYISTSPDGVYQGMNLYVPNETPRESLRNLTLLFSGFNSSVVMAVAEVQTGRILAYAHINRDDMSNSRGGAWDCIDIRKGPCIQYQSSFPDTKIELPPNPWRRLVAWGAYKLRGLGKPELFGKVEHRRSEVFTPRQFDDHYAARVCVFAIPSTLLASNTWGIGLKKVLPCNLQAKNSKDTKNGSWPRKRFLTVATLALSRCLPRDAITGHRLTLHVRAHLGNP